MEKNQVYRNNNLEKENHTENDDFIKTPYLGGPRYKLEHINFKTPRFLYSLITMSINFSIAHRMHHSQPGKKNDIPQQIHHQSLLHFLDYKSEQYDG